MTAPGKTLCQNSDKALDHIDTKKELAKLAKGHPKEKLFPNSGKAIDPIDTEEELAKLAGVSHAGYKPA